MLALVVGFAIAFPFHERILEWLIDPLPDDRQLVTFGVTEPFFTSVKVSLAAAFLLALPVILWQVWSFLAPAFEEHASASWPCSSMIATALPAGGLAFGYFVVLPRALEFLTTYDENLYQIKLRASYYITFVTFSLLAMALIFQLPIFVLALVRLGVVTSSTLRGTAAPVSRSASSRPRCSLRSTPSRSSSRRSSAHPVRAVDLGRGVLRTPLDGVGRPAAAARGLMGWACPQGVSAPNSGVDSLGGKAGEPWRRARWPRGAARRRFLGVCPAHVKPLIEAD